MSTAASKATPASPGSSDREAARLAEAVRAAAGEGALELVGGGSKGWLGRRAGRPARQLELRGHEGVIDYVPDELMVRVRAGTRLVELVALLADRGQFLACEPPITGEAATVGGAVAAGLSGSRRPYAGALRDQLLGVGLIGADGVYHAFGGQVMKNVAGYDVSRLMAGSLGILGVIADASFRLLPLPPAEMTLALPASAGESLSLFRRLKREGQPLSGACWFGGEAYLRMSGHAASVKAASASLKKQWGAREADSSLWAQLDSRQHPVFAGEGDLLRLACAPGRPLAEDCFLIDWGGAQRWLAAEGQSLPAPVHPGDSWTRYPASPEDEGEVFTPLPEPLMRVHQALKRAFDPKGVFNPGRMFKAL